VRAFFFGKAVRCCRFFENHLTELSTSGKYTLVVEEHFVNISAKDDHKIMQSPGYYAEGEG